MQIKEVRGIYQSQIKDYERAKSDLMQRKQELQEKIKTTPNGNVIYQDEAVSLELSIEAVEKKQNAYQDYMDKLLEKKNSIVDMLSSEQQTESMKEYTEEQLKIIEVARRLMKGARVPQYDEMKLMQYDSSLYQMAKNIGAMVKAKEKEEYESLWADDEEKEREDPQEVADSAEAPVGAPEIVSAEQTVSAAPESL
ncbi:MAG: hypothetical protein PUC49_00605 [Clostridiales bacterium]|nr:hypothetical protein [Clostridiales bacterium]